MAGCLLSSCEPSSSGLSTPSSTQPARAQNTTQQRGNVLPASGPTPRLQGSSSLWTTFLLSPRASYRVSPPRSKTPATYLQQSQLAFPCTCHPLIRLWSQALIYDLPMPQGILCCGPREPVYFRLLQVSTHSLLAHLHTGCLTSDVRPSHGSFPWLLYRRSTVLCTSALSKVKTPSFVPWPTGGKLLSTDNWTRCPRYIQGSQLAT